MPTYRLHYFPESGNSYKLALMLTLCEQPFELVWTDFFSGVTRTAAWRSTVNAMGEIPVLEDGAIKRTQTGSILLRLAARYGRFEVQGEERRDELLRWLLWDNHKLTSYLATYRFQRAFTRNADPSVLAFLRGRVDAALDVLECHLKDRPFVLGEEPTIVDLSMCGYLYFPAEETGLELSSSFPCVARWLAGLAKLPNWRGPYDLLIGQRYRDVSPSAGMS